MPLVCKTGELRPTRAAGRPERGDAPILFRYATVLELLHHLVRRHAGHTGYGQRLPHPLEQPAAIPGFFHARVANSLSKE